MPFNSETAAQAGAKGKRGPEKRNAEVKEKLQQIIANKLEELEADLQVMTKKDQWDLLAKLSEYAFPKLARIQTELEIQNQTIVFENVSKKFPNGK